jgi:hypothetical protein
VISQVIAVAHYPPGSFSASSRAVPYDAGRGPIEARERA